MSIISALESLSESELPPSTEFSRYKANFTLYLVSYLFCNIHFISKHEKDKPLLHAAILVKKNASKKYWNQPI